MLTNEPFVSQATIETADLLEGDKNAKQIVCERCQSKILPPKMGTYEESEFELHPMKKKKEDDEEIPEKLKQFFRVEDMFDFDNIGFTKAVGDVKYLICADCEIGPLGYSQANKCYIALARVAYL